MEDNCLTPEQSKLNLERFEKFKIIAVKQVGWFLILSNYFLLILIKGDLNFLMFVPAGFGIVVLLFARHFSRRFE